MLYFNFKNYREFATRKNQVEFAEMLAKVKKSLKSYQRKERKLTAKENRAFVRNVQERIFSVSKCITAIRAELLENPQEYTRLNLNAKEVSRAYLLVRNEEVFTLRKVTLNVSEWELSPVKSVKDCIKSLRQKARLVELAQKALDKGQLPEFYKNGRGWVASACKGEI